jgi:hypothetical protein
MNNNFVNHHYPRQGNNLQPQADVVYIFISELISKACRLRWLAQWHASSSEVKLLEQEAEHSLPSDDKVLGYV